MSNIPPADTTDYLATAKSPVMGDVPIYVLALSGGQAFVTMKLGGRGFQVPVSGLYNWQTNND
jgi:hypothetical protein